MAIFKRKAKTHSITARLNEKTSGTHVEIRLTFPVGHAFYAVAALREISTDHNLSNLIDSLIAEGEPSVMRAVGDGDLIYKPNE